MKHLGYRLTTLSTFGRRTFLAQQRRVRHVAQQPSRVLSASLATVLLISTIACGTNLIRVFRVALASSGPLVTSLVNAGAISQPDATRITQDFEDSVRCADGLQMAFKTIPKDSPNAKSLKLTASVNGLKCFRVVLQRQNFAKHKRIQDVANIAEGILSSLVVFYSEPGLMVADARASQRAITAKDEADLEKKLSDKVDELKAAMKPARCRNSITGRFEKADYCRTNPSTSQVEH